MSVPVVLHAGVDRSPVQDGGMWDWFTPAGQPDSGDTATKITYPKRLVQQIKSEEEMAHDHLDTRVKNSTGDSLVSCNQQQHPPLFPHRFHSHIPNSVYFHIAPLCSQNDLIHWPAEKKYPSWIILFL